MNFEHQHFSAIRMSAILMVLDRRIALWGIEEILTPEILDDLFSVISDKERFSHLEVADVLSEYFEEAGSIPEIIHDLEIYQGYNPRIGYQGNSTVLQNQSEDCVREIAKYIKSEFYTYIKSHVQTPARINDGGRFCQLRDTFRLSDSEFQIFTFHVFYAAHRLFFYRNDISGPFLYKFIKSLYGFTEFEIKQLHSLAGALAKKGLVSKREKDSRGLFELTVNSAIFNYLMGDTATPYDSRIMTDARDPRFPADSFDIDSMESRMCRQLLECRRPSNILLYGAPGAGKTEFALTYTRGMKPLLFKAGDKDAIEHFAVALTVSSHTGRPLIVDEADQLLVTANSFFFSATSGQKKLMNELLDSSRGKCIFITNSISFIDPSTLRRFHQIIRFPELLSFQRKRIWESISSSHQLNVDDHDIEQFAKTYKVTPGIINLALENAKIHEGEKKTRVISRTIERYLEACGETVPELPDPRSKTPFDVSLLNVDMSADALQSIIEPYIHHRDLPGTAFLFWGPPGTGKSAFGRYIAERIGYEFVYRRMSDLLSPFVGQNEQNIASMFRDAARTPSVLMIDEADSLMSERKNALRSWESSLVNEFLSQLEATKSIVICTTNLLQNLDSAALRRFPWKIGFKPLKTGDAVRACRLYFPAQFGDAAGFQDLPSGLTLGDFGAVHRKFIPRLVSNPDDLSRNEILSALKEEQAYRSNNSGDSQGRVITGFSA